MGAILVLSTLLFQSYVSHFQTAYVAAELWKGDQTTLGEYLTAHGIFLFVIATFLVWESLQTTMVRGTLRMAYIVVRFPSHFAHILSLRHALSPPQSVAQKLNAILIGVALLI
jgi:hypothetical protein